MSKKNFAKLLEVDYILSPLGGAIGLTHCPGRCSIDNTGKQWNRDLAEDIASLKNQNITAVVSLLGSEELVYHGAQGIKSLLTQARIKWYQFPIPDFGVPSSETMKLWLEALPQLLKHMQEGQKVVVHCAAGYGRTGMMTAALLIAMGVETEEAIASVRAARPGTIETPAQEAFIRSLQHQKMMAKIAF